MLVSISKVIVAIFAVTTMFGVGITLTPRGFAQSLGRGYVARSLFASFVLLPLLALLIIKVLDPSPAVAISLLLVATLPGAPAVVKLVSMSRGDVAQAVGLVIVLMVASMAFAPVALPLLIDGVAVSAFDIVRTLVFGVLLPLLAGLILRAGFASAAQRLAPIMPPISLVSGLALLVLVPIAYSDQMGSLLELRTLSALVVFLGLAITIGWLTGGQERGGRRVLAIACGQGNQAAAFLVATHNFADPRMPAVVISMTLISVGMLVPVVLQFARRAPVPMALRENRPELT